MNLNYKERVNKILNKIEDGASSNIDIQYGQVYNKLNYTLDGKEIKIIKQLITPDTLFNGRFQLLPNNINIENVEINVTSKAIEFIGLKVFNDISNTIIEVAQGTAYSQVSFNYSVVDTGQSGSITINDGDTFNLNQATSGTDVILTNVRYRDVATNNFVDLDNVTFTINVIPTNAFGNGFGKIGVIILGDSLSNNVNAYLDSFNRIIHPDGLEQSYIVTMQYTEV